MRWKVSMALALVLGLGLLTTLFAQDARRLAEAEKVALIEHQDSGKDVTSRLESIVDRTRNVRPAAGEIRADVIKRQILEDPVLSQDPETRQRVWDLEVQGAIARANADPGLSGPERLRLLQRELRSAEATARQLKQSRTEGGKR